MSYSQSYTNVVEIKTEIINQIPEVLPGMSSSNSTPVDKVLRPASITGDRVLERIWYWPDTDILQKSLNPKHIIKERLTNPTYGREELNRKIQEMATNASSIEEIWQITEKLPSLSDLLLEEQNDE